MKKPQFLNQLKSYIIDGNFEYVFNKAKLLGEVKPNPEIFVKKEFQKIFKNNYEEIFKQNPKFFIDNGISNAEILKALSEKEKLINHPILNFIKVK